MSASAFRGLPKIKTDLLSDFEFGKGRIEDLWLQIVLELQIQGLSVSEIIQLTGIPIDQISELVEIIEGIDPDSIQSILGTIHYTNELVSNALNIVSNDAVVGVALDDDQAKLNVILRQSATVASLKNAKFFIPLPEANKQPLSDNGIAVPATMLFIYKLLQGIVQRGHKMFVVTDAVVNDNKRGGGVATEMSMTPGVNILNFLTAISMVAPADLKSQGITIMANSQFYQQLPMYRNYIEQQLSDLPDVIKLAILNVVDQMNFGSGTLGQRMQGAIESILPTEG